MFFVQSSFIYIVFFRTEICFHCSEAGQLPPMDSSHPHHPRSCFLTIGFEEFVNVGQQVQQLVQVVLGGAALQQCEEQDRGLALHPLQWEATRGRRAAVPQL